MPLRRGGWVRASTSVTSSLAKRAAGGAAGLNIRIYRGLMAPKKARKAADAIDLTEMASPQEKKQKVALTTIAKESVRSRKNCRSNR